MTTVFHCELGVPRLGSGMLGAINFLEREKKMSLQVKRENVPEKKVVLKTGEGEGSMIIRQAFGNESSLLVVSRPPGYHTRPHMHASEQINHVLEGEIWFFVEDRGYHCKKGTFTHPGESRPLGVESFQRRHHGSRISFAAAGRR